MRLKKLIKKLDEELWYVRNNDYKEDSYLQANVTIGNHIFDVYMTYESTSVYTTHMDNKDKDYSNVSAYLEEHMAPLGDIEIEPEYDEYDYNGFQSCVDYWKYRL